MNVLNVIKEFDKEFDYFPKDRYKGVFHCANLIMDYYTQKRKLSINDSDDIIDALFACYAYEKIHDPKTVQGFFPKHILVEYSSILHKYLGGRNRLEVEALVERWKLTNSNPNNKILEN